MDILLCLVYYTKCEYSRLEYDQILSQFSQMYFQITYVKIETFISWFIMLMLNHLTFVLLFPVHNVNATCVLIHTCSCIYQMPIYYKTLTLFNRYITSRLFIFFRKTLKHKNRKLYVFTYRYFMKSLIICKCLNFSP